MPKLLDQIHSPRDLKKLPPEKLSQLADEIRALILEVISKNGGHLASNLGVVELTIALHRVFDSPPPSTAGRGGHPSLGLLRR